MWPDTKIFIGIGGNLTSDRFGPPLATCAAALRALEHAGLRIAAKSRWYRSEPLPKSAQPWFINGVARIVTDAGPSDLLLRLHDIEAALGRRRSQPNAARVIDLDLLAYGDLVAQAADDGGPILPHPRLHERAFVLRPLAEIEPEWRHPASGLSIAQMIAALPRDQIAEPITATGDNA